MGRMIRRFSFVACCLILLVFFTSCSIFDTFLNYGSYVGVEGAINKYCKSHTEMTFSNVTDFAWDIAYVDFTPYGEGGKKIKETYGVQGEFAAIGSDACYRVAFCLSDILVEDLILNKSTIDLTESVEIIYPNTEFFCKWETQSFKDSDGQTTYYDRLYLTPKN